MGISHEEFCQNLREGTERNISGMLKEMRLISTVEVVAVISVAVASLCGFIRHGETWVLLAAPILAAGMWAISSSTNPHATAQAMRESNEAFIGRVEAARKRCSGRS